MLDKKRIYTDQQKAFLNAMSDPDNGGNVRRCMDLAGYAKNSPMSSVTRSLKDELIAIAKDLMASHSIKATLSLFSVIDNPSQLGAANAINAAKQVLDRSNIVQEETNIKVNVGEGLVILPAKDIGAKVESDTVGE